MGDLYAELKELSPVDILEKLDSVTDPMEEKFYVGLLNLKAELDFEGVVNGK